MATVPVNPDLIQWAIDRAGFTVDDLTEKNDKITAWLTGEKQPTFSQLGKFAKKVHVPFGYLFLKKPPEETLTIPDFRTVGDTAMKRPSPSLLETIQTMQRRQSWMRDFLIEEGHPRLPFVEIHKRLGNVKKLAETIRKDLGFATDWMDKVDNRGEAFRTLRSAAEKIGILVFSHTFVGNQTARSLDPEEFRGFVLHDVYAPLIFINRVDAEAAQVFTLAHELVHIWLGKDGLVNLQQTLPFNDKTEQFCNQVAVEILVPEEKFKAVWEQQSKNGKSFPSIAKRFKVSSLVAARRALELGFIQKPEFFRFYQKNKDEWEKRKEEEKKKDGGPVFNILKKSQLSQNFSRAVVQASREGKLLYQHAYRLTETRGKSFETFANSVAEGEK